MEKQIKVLFWHGHFSEGYTKDDHFGPTGTIHQQLEKRSKKLLDWSLLGGFIHEGRDDFFVAAQTANILFALPANMDYDNEKMHWDVAEDLMLEIVKKIRRSNKKIKIFFIEEPHHANEKFAKYGEFVLDLHDPMIADYIKSL
jgi:hypothetical protein